VDRVNTLERAARARFEGWAVYRKFTRCDSCAWQRYCGAARKRGPFLCVDCFDLRVKP
jgi:hypothetical protein